MAETTSHSGVLDGLDTHVLISVAGLGGVAFQIQGLFVGTITFEASVQGQDFAPLRVTPSNTSTAVTTATAPGLWTGSATGYLAVRARMSSYSSGQAQVHIRSDAASPGGGGGGGGTGSDVNLIEVGGASIALGQTTSSASIPVVLPSDFTGMPVTIADGDDVAEGATTDATVQGNNTGTVNARLRGLSVIQNDVWDSVNHRIRVDGGGTQYDAGDASPTPVVGTAVLTVNVNDGTFQTLTSDDDGSLNVQILSTVDVDGEEDEDTPLGPTAPVVVGGRASAAAPSAVSADGDAVVAWFLRNGAQATVLTATGALMGGDAANGLDVDVTRSVLPTGAATSALQTQPGVDIGDVTVNNGAGAAAVNIQDGGNSITVDYATTGSGTSTGALRVELPTNGTGVIATVGAVTAITNALPAGSNAIGKLAANAGVTIGAVEIAAAQTLATVTTVTTVTTVSTVSSVTAVGTITPGTAATSLGKAEDAAHTSGDVGVFALAVANAAQATLAADGDYIAFATDIKGNQLAVGNIAHDGADAGNPLKVGNKAADYGATPTAVATSDRTDAYADRAGVPFVIGGHMDVVTLEAEYTSAQTNAAIVTVSAGTRIVVTQIQAVVSNATSVDVAVRVGFATATTPTTTGVVLTHPGIKSSTGSGISRGDGTGILGIGADNEDLRITSGAATSGALRILVTYFTIAT